ncbi:DUF2158 domain-containing protein [Bradyrhizobium jicamae]|uniref:DUF2158 domain-containing protein n=1 Tax=Bradyrhizobium jicamae TaxID=280332 RepID=UPI001BA8518E|nr:DUF2158 domain-containing protein [Bradyrhizobium jicamae]MBR0757279.1 DUF2158 domain-containing protein [Bradyrhizobium jicamae]
MELKPGDVAILKSGGHPVTVVEVSEDKAECLWMGVDGDLFRDTLPLIALESTELDDSEDEDEDHDEDEDENGDEAEDDEAEDDDRKKKKRKAA